MRNNIKLIVSILLITVLFALVGCSYTTKKNTQEALAQLEELQKTQKLPEEPQKPTFLEQLKQDMDSELADQVNSVLVNEIGFENIEYIGKSGETDNYEIWAESIKTTITAIPAVEEEPAYIRVFQPYGDVFYEDGEVVMTGEELRTERKHIKNTETYYIIAQSIIKDIANTSNKMNFPGSVMESNEIMYGWKEEYVLIKSWVEIQNNLGVYEKYDYIVEFIPTDLDNFQYDVVYVNIDGEVIGEMVDVGTLHIYNK